MTTNFGYTKTNKNTDPINWNTNWCIKAELYWCSAHNNIVEIVSTQTEQTFFAIKLRLQYLLTLNRFRLSRRVSKRKSFIVSNQLSTNICRAVK